MARLSFTLLLLACGTPVPALASPTADAGIAADSDELDREAKLAEFKAILARYPDDPDANFNIGVAYQLKEQPELALPHFETALKADQDDWHSVAKLVQVNQALGRLEARDRWRDRLLVLYREGKVLYPDAQPAPVYCRDQFRVEKFWVMVLEHFELIGRRAVRYTFDVLAKPGTPPPLRSISLGSYDFDQPGALRRGDISPGERLFHLDGYWPDNSHATYGFYGNEPSYDVVRKRVLAILESPASERRLTSSETVVSPGTANVFLFPDGGK
jgi:hypothetical protein